MYPIFEPAGTPASSKAIPVWFATAAGWNETAFIQAIDPKLVHPERYQASMATPRPPAGTWSAFPFPSPIILYQAGQGYPKFDQAKADSYFAAVTDKMSALVLETVGKWDQAGLFQ